MGRELQKHKNRSSKPKVKPKVLGRTKAGKKKVNFLGNETIAQNWDRALTLEQNYKRLGLSTRLNSSIAGPKKIKGRSASEAGPAKHDSLAIAPSNLQATTKPQEVRVERDPETGRILRVVQSDPDEANRNPLNDPLNDVSDEEAEFETGRNSSNIVSQLEAQAAQEAEIEAKRKRPRQQSSREEEWIAKLVEAHGDDIPAMSRDRKLNPMQQSQGDIARRVKKWKQKHS
ncbi:Nucleolar protein 16 [Exophiala xenobiotica]|uniref:Nucleolar protein 16 n=1 Tax=Lithohypha guttulata TaxID=1690604 RepID=A0ABR0KB72_9EURO|nr:Nucleolar protein 16 [Lithohypha guttulata]KAK5318058.1 Nucleolar protein 16 [Exophiala xenobiotica]